MLKINSCVHTTEDIFSDTIVSFLGLISLACRTYLHLCLPLMFYFIIFFPSVFLYDGSIHLKHLFGI